MSWSTQASATYGRTSAFGEGDQGRPDRPKFKTAGNARLDTSAAELGEAARAFAANFGTWSVNEADKTLTPQGVKQLLKNASRISGQPAGTFQKEFGFGLLDGNLL